MLRLRPCTVTAARRYVAEHHRHLPRIQGAMWAVQVVDETGRIRGVAMVGHPARMLMERGWLCVLRVATDGARNACSMLYGACSRAARAMGAAGLITYTLEHEPGTSLRAAGWIDMGLTRGGSWSRPSRRRQPPIEGGRKRRWVAPWSETIDRREG